MIRKECSIKFFIKKVKKNHVDGQPICCRISYDRKKVEFSIGQHVDPSKWDAHLGIATRNARLNAYLAKIKTKILDLKYSFEERDELISAKKLKDSLLNKSTDEEHLLEYMDRQIERYALLTDEYTLSTVKKYKVARNLLSSFTKYQKKKSYNIKSLDYSFIKKWDAYLIACPEDTHRRRTRNTANSYHKRLKKILGEAVKEKRLDQNPYVHFPIKDTKVEKEALSIRELNRMQQDSLAYNQSLLKARDIFMFTCFTGLRFQDGQNLAPNNIYKDETGTYWLKYKQQKVNSTVDFPLLDVAKSILDKYKEESKITNRLLPKLSNQKTNLYLKSIAEIIGIDKHLTHHIARHTFATTVLRENEIPMDVTKEWLGHSTGNDITLLYAKLGKKIKLQYKDHLDRIFTDFLVSRTYTL